MADVQTTLSQIQGWTKEIEGEVQRLAFPKLARATKRMPFKERKRIGEAIVYPVWTSSEGGFTHGAGSSLRDAKAAASQQARLSGEQITLRSLIDIKVLTSAATDKQSFGAYFTEHKIQCKRSFARRLETLNLYGNRSIAQLSAVSGTSTTRVFTISEKTFAPHIFLGTKTHALDAYNGTDKLNDIAPILITSYNPRTRELAVSGNATDLTAVDGAGASTELYWETTYGNMAAGLRAIGSETGSVTYANINHSSNPDTWQGTVVDCGSVAFDWDLLNQGLEEAAGKGCEAPLIAQCSLRTWGNLITDLNALRAFDSSYQVEKGELGVKSIKFHGVNDMPVTIEPSGFIKRGEVIAFPDVSDGDYADLLERIGSTDVTSMHPLDSGEMVVQVPGTNFFETKYYSDQSVKANPRDVLVWENVVPR